MRESRFAKVPVSELRLGMYIVELDRPWLETPFLIQGFVLKRTEDLEIIRDICNHVYIDTQRSVKYGKMPADYSRPKAKTNALTQEKLQELFSTRIRKYSDSNSFDDEVVGAQKVYADYEELVANLYDGFKINQSVNLSSVKGTVNGIVESVIRNPDACMLLAKLKRKGDYNYNHAIGSSIWAASLGRQLGLPKPNIISMATGALLIDVGKLHLSDRLLNKITPLSREEYALVKTHVQHGVEMIAKSRENDPVVLQMVKHHHERHNGAGYPDGLKGSDIPIYGRIAGLVDCYDALISDKPYRIGLPPSEAVKELYKVRDIDFQSALIEEFIQSIGIYPAGSLVELTSGEVGIVVSEHRRRRLRPKLLIILDAEKTPLDHKKYLDLFETKEDQSGNLLEIKRSVTAGEYGIDLDNILI
jgi:HD-GYP domain-containing protein (c-di-GMP phosphodiesterase class II)